MYITGRLINQLGIIESSTSVNLNGRIDLKASYWDLAPRVSLARDATGSIAPKPHSAA